MNMTSSLMVGVALIAVSTPAARAMDNMHGPAMMPTCAVGDPVVSVNPKTKMYVPAGKQHMTGSAMKGDAMKGDAMKGDAMKGDAMKGGAMKGDAMKTTATMMCKSKADAMGAHMMKG